MQHYTLTPHPFDGIAACGPHADDEGEFEVVEELGFHTEVGLGPPRAEDRNKNANLEHSIGYRVQRIKGHFVTPSEQPHALTAAPSDWNQLYRRSEEGVASATHCLTADCERSPRVWHSGVQVLSLRLPEPVGEDSCERR